MKSLVKEFFLTKTCWLPAFCLILIVCFCPGRLAFGESAATTLRESIDLLDDGRYPVDSWSMRPLVSWRVDSAPGWFSRVLIPACCDNNDPNRDWLFENINPDLADWMRMGIFLNRDDFARDRGIRIIGAGDLDWEWDTFGWSDALADKLFKMGRINPERLAFAHTHYGQISGCQNSPLFSAAKMQGNLHYASTGDGVGQDQLCVNNICSSEVCRFCKEKFQRYLASRHSIEELLSWGITDISKVDFEDARKFPEDNKREGLYNAAQSFVLDSFVYEVAKHAGLVREQGRRLGKEPVFYGNLSHNFGMNPTFLYYVPYLDAVWLEASNLAPVGSTWQGGASAGDGFRQAWGPLNVKVGLAAGGYRKPVVCCYTAGDYLTALANGGTQVNYYDPFHPVASLRSGEYMAMSKFIHANRALFANRVPYANVALVYSLKHAGRFAHLFRGYANILQNAHIPFRVVIFGDGERWDDSETLASLGNYELLVLPGILTLTDKQAKAVKTFLKSGGHLVIAGRTAPELDGLPDDSITTVNVRDISVFTHGTQAAEGRGKESPVEGDLSFESLRDSVLGNLNRQFLITDASNKIWMEIFQHTDAARLSLHMMNYSGVESKEIMVEVLLPEWMNAGEAEVFFWDYPKAEPERLDFSVASGKARFVLPRIKADMKDRYAIVSIHERGLYESANAISISEQLLDRLEICAPHISEGLREKLAVVQKRFSERDIAESRPLLEGLCGKIKFEYNRVVDDNINNRADFRKDSVSRGASAFRAYDFGVDIPVKRNIQLPADTMYRRYGIPLDYVERPAPVGWIKVGPEKKYDTETGYGFLDTVGLGADAFLYPSDNPVFIDRVEGTRDATFRIDIPNGRYIFTVLTYGAYATPNSGGGLMSLRDYESYPNLYANGKLVLLGYPDRHDRIEAHSFDAEVKDGKIELLFSGGRGASNNRNNCWYINGLIIEKRAGDRAVKSPDQIIYALRDWRISEVYTDAEALGFDRIYPPEKGVGEKWYRYTDRNEGYARISFADILRKNDDVVAYAKTFVKSDDEQFGTLRFGSTGRGKVWLNGELISVDNATHGLKPDEYVKKILLRQGWNEIMVKVCNNWGEDWAFTAALVPENRAVLIQDAGREVVGHISTIEYSSVKSFSTGPYSEGIADEKAKERFHESVRDGWTGDFSYDDGNTVEGERSFKVEAKRGQRIVVRNLFDAPIDISGYEAFECWIKAVNEKRETGKAEVLIQVGFGNAMYATLMPTAPSDTGFTITVSFPLNKWEKLYIPVPEKYLVGVYQILWYLSSQDADVTFYVDEIKLK